MPSPALSNRQRPKRRIHPDLGPQRPLTRPGNPLPSHSKRLRCLPSAQNNPRRDLSPVLHRRRHRPKRNPYRSRRRRPSPGRIRLRQRPSRLLRALGNPPTKMATLRAIRREPRRSARRLRSPAHHRQSNRAQSSSRLAPLLLDPNGPLGRHCTRDPSRLPAAQKTQRTRSSHLRAQTETSRPPGLLPPHLRLDPFPRLAQPRRERLRMVERPCPINPPHRPGSPRYLRHLRDQRYIDGDPTP